MKKAGPRPRKLPTHPAIPGRIRCYPKPAISPPSSTDKGQLIQQRPRTTDKQRTETTSPARYTHPSASTGSSRRSDERRHANQAPPSSTASWAGSWPRTTWRRPPPSVPCWQFRVTIFIHQRAGQRMFSAGIKPSPSNSSHCTDRAPDRPDEIAAVAVEVLIGCTNAVSSRPC